MTRLRFIGALFCAVITASGCGYTTRSAISSSYKKIYIMPFVNKIDLSLETYVSNSNQLYRPGLETALTRAVIDKYLFDGNLRPASQESSSLILEGELVDFRRAPLRYDDNDNVSEYRVSIVVHIKLKDTRSGEIKWEENTFTGDTTYFTAGSQAKTESTSIQDALTDLARRIVERTVEQW